MATRYWVGGSGTWDSSSTTHWSATSGGAAGASVPLSTDTVIFNTASGTGSYTVTYTATTAGVNTTINGPASGTLNFNLGANFFGATTLRVGNLAQLVVFNTTVANYSIIATTFTIGVGGTLTLNGSTVSCGVITATGTINAGTSSITFSRTFTGNSKTFYNVIFTSSSAGYLTGSNTFNNLTITGNTSTGTSYGLSIGSGTTQIINGTLTVTSSTNITYRTYLGILSNDVSGTYATLTCAAVSLVNTDFYGVIINGVAAPASGTNLGNIGNNTGITFPASKTVYWNLAGTQTWTATAWATSSGGTPALNNFPLPQDNVVFNDAGSAGTVSLTGDAYVKNLSFASRTTAMTLNIVDLILYVGGNSSFGTAATISSTNPGRLVFINSTGKTVTGNNGNLAALILANISSITLLSSISVGGYEQLYSTASVDLNGQTLTANFDPSANSAAFSGNVTFNGGTLISTSYFIADTGASFTAGTGSGTIRFTGSTGTFFETGGATYNCTIDYALTGGAGLEITSNSGDPTFDNITNSVSPAVIQFSPYNTYTFNNFNLRGAAGALVTITSGALDTQYTLSKSSGTVTSNYLSIQDSVATGGAVWYAGGNSVNAGNNTGWIFGGNSGAMAVFLP